VNPQPINGSQAVHQFLDYRRASRFRRATSAFDGIWKPQWPACETLREHGRQ
jgi:hypothetical protein